MTLVHDTGLRPVQTVLVLVWALLIGAATLWGITNEQEDLVVRASQQLAGADIRFDELVVSGRDVAIWGVDAREARRAAAVAGTVTGIRTVTVHVSEVGSNPTEPAPISPGIGGQS